MYDMRLHKKWQQDLQLYSVASFVVSWLQWLQIILNEYKWLSMFQIDQLKSFGVMRQQN